MSSSSLKSSSVTSYRDNLDDDLQSHEKSIHCVPGEKNREEAVHDLDLLRFVVQSHFLTCNHYLYCCCCRNRWKLVQLPSGDRLECVDCENTDSKEGRKEDPD